MTDVAKFLKNVPNLANYFFMAYEKLRAFKTWKQYNGKPNNSHYLNFWDYIFKELSTEFTTKE